MVERHYGFVDEDPPPPRCPARTLYAAVLERAFRDLDEPSHRSDACWWFRAEQPKLFLNYVSFRDCESVLELSAKQVEYILQQVAIVERMLEPVVIPEEEQN